MIDANKKTAPIPIITTLGAIGINENVYSANNTVPNNTLTSPILYRIQELSDTSNGERLRYSEYTAIALSENITTNAITTKLLT